MRRFLLGLLVIATAGVVGVTLRPLQAVRSQPARTARLLSHPKSPTPTPGAVLLYTPVERPKAAVSAGTAGPSSSGPQQRTASPRAEALLDFDGPTLARWAAETAARPRVVALLPGVTVGRSVLNALCQATGAVHVPYRDLPTALDDGSLYLLVNRPGAPPAGVLPEAAGWIQTRTLGNSHVALLGARSTGALTATLQLCSQRLALPVRQSQSLRVRLLSTDDARPPWRALAEAAPAVEPVALPGRTVAWQLIVCHDKDGPLTCNAPALTCGAWENGSHLDTAALGVSGALEPAGAVPLTAFAPHRFWVSTVIDGEAPAGELRAALELKAGAHQRTVELTVRACEGFASTWPPGLAWCNLTYATLSAAGPLQRRRFTSLTEAQYRAHCGAVAGALLRYGRPALCFDALACLPSGQPLIRWTRKGGAVQVEVAALSKLIRECSCTRAGPSLILRLSHAALNGTPLFEAGGSRVGAVPSDQLLAAWREQLLPQLAVELGGDRLYVVTTPSLAARCRALRPPLGAKVVSLDDLPGVAVDPLEARLRWWRAFTVDAASPPWVEAPWPLVPLHADLDRASAGTVWRTVGLENYRLGEEDWVLLHEAARRLGEKTVTAIARDVAAAGRGPEAARQDLLRAWTAAAG